MPGNRLDNNPDTMQAQHRLAWPDHDSNHMERKT